MLWRKWKQPKLLHEPGKRPNGNGGFCFWKPSGAVSDLGWVSGGYSVFSMSLEVVLDKGSVRCGGA